MGKNVTKQYAFNDTVCIINGFSKIKKECVNENVFKSSTGCFVFLGFCF